MVRTSSSLPNKFRQFFLNCVPGNLLQVQPATLDKTAEFDIWRVSDPTTVITLDDSASTRLLIAVTALIEFALTAAQGAGSVTVVSADHTLGCPPLPANEMCKHERTSACSARNLMALSIRKELHLDHATFFSKN